MASPSDEYFVKIISSENVTHNVKRFTLTKPASYHFKPGQATDIVIDLPEWKKERRPFTFTGLNDWKNLEFTIKIYDDHPGVTNQMGKLKEGDGLILHDVFGAIQYKGEGTFIAGGAGITPFIAIFRQLEKDGKLGNNKILFSNKKEEDIILHNELDKMLGNNFINTLTKETNDKYHHGMIDENYLKENTKNLVQYFYICGPDAMIEAISKNLENMGVDKSKIVKEEW